MSEVVYKNRVRKERIILRVFSESKYLCYLIELENKVPWYMLRKKWVIKKKIINQSKVFIKQLNKLS